MAKRLDTIVCRLLKRQMCARTLTQKKGIKSECMIQVRNINKIYIQTNTQSSTITHCIHYTFAMYSVVLVWCVRFCIIYLVGRGLLFSAAEGHIEYIMSRVYLAEFDIAGLKCPAMQCTYNCNTQISAIIASVFSFFFFEQRILHLRDFVWQRFSGNSSQILY